SNCLTSSGISSILVDAWVGRATLEDTGHGGRALLLVQLGPEASRETLVRVNEALGIGTRQPRSRRQTWSAMRIEAGSAAPSSTPHPRSFTNRQRCCSASTAALGPRASSRPSITTNRGRTSTARAISTRNRSNAERSARTYEAQSDKPTCAKPVHARRLASFTVSPPAAREWPT